MFFISYELYLYGMFLMKKGVFAGGFRSWMEPTTGSESLLLFKINIFRPAKGLAIPPLRSTILAPLVEAVMKRA